MTPLMGEVLSNRRRALQPEVAAAFQDVGIPIDTTLLLGVDYVQVNGCIYEPAPDGASALTVPYLNDSGELEDIVAIGLRSRRSATRCGRAQILGAHWLDEAFMEDSPVPTYLDGLRWLHSGCRGVFLVRPEIAPYVLEEAPGIACSDDFTLRRIHAAMTRPVRVPPLYSAEVQHVTA